MSYVKYTLAYDLSIFKKILQESYYNISRPNNMVKLFKGIGKLAILK